MGMKEQADYKKAMVRPCVTYSIVWFYIGFTTLVGLLALFHEEAEINNGFLTIYTGLTTLTASIVAFWFGNRSAKSSSSGKEEGETKNEDERAELQNDQ